MKLRGREAYPLTLPQSVHWNGLCIMVGTMCRAITAMPSSPVAKRLKALSFVVTVGVRIVEEANAKALTMFIPLHLPLSVHSVGPRE